MQQWEQQDCQGLHIKNCLTEAECFVSPDHGNCHKQDSFSCSELAHLRSLHWIPVVFPSIDNAQEREQEEGAER